MAQDLGDPKIRADFSRFLLTQLNDQIKNADTKAIGTLGILGILTAALLTRLNAIKSQTGITTEWMILFGISVVLLIVAFKFILRVVYPRLSKPSGKNPIYFRDIASLNKEAYAKKGAKFTAEETIAFAYADAHDLSVVANAKYLALRQAMIVTILAVVWTILVLLIS